ncbi:MAG TPA: hypothetical protein VMI12_09985 [Puia sp.]|nr:hypothetical protein [Puia sp.]
MKIITGSVLLSISQCYFSNDNKVLYLIAFKPTFNLAWHPDPRLFRHQWQ